MKISCINNLFSSSLRLFFFATLIILLPYKSISAAYLPPGFAQTAENQPQTGFPDAGQPGSPAPAVGPGEDTPAGGDIPFEGEDVLSISEEEKEPLTKKNNPKIAEIVARTSKTLKAIGELHKKIEALRDEQENNFFDFSNELDEYFRTVREEEGRYEYLKTVDQSNSEESKES